MSNEDYLGFVFIESGNYVTHMTLVACFWSLPQEQCHLSPYAFPGTYFCARHPFLPVDEFQGTAMNHIHIVSDNLQHNSVADTS